MPSELQNVQQQQQLQDRQIRKILLWLQRIAVAEGIRATQIIGVIPDDNMPASAAGGTLVYVGFGDEPDGTAGLAHSGGNAIGHTMDLIVKT